MTQTPRSEVLGLGIWLAMVGAGLTWCAGLVMLGINVWAMRSGMQSLELWRWAGAGLAVGVVVCPFAIRALDPDPAAVRVAVVGLLATPVALGGFLWLTMVSPTTSEQGQLAREFFRRLAARDDAGAHALLSPEAQELFPLASFRASLPLAYTAQRGASVNAVSSTIGTVIGDSGCVDGSRSTSPTASPAAPSPWV